MSVVVPFRDPRPKAHLASRRTYRDGCKQLASAAFGEAFNQSLRQPGVGEVGINEAVSIFVAAMRRELRQRARGAGIPSVRL
jgi:hypothetical protein